MRVTAHGQGSAEAGNGDDMKFRKKPVVIEAVQFAGSEREATMSYYEARKYKGTSCEKCGNDERLVVHHHDKNPRNNAVENLVTICSSCHVRWHRYERANGIGPSEAKAIFQC